MVLPRPNPLTPPTEGAVAPIFALCIYILHGLIVYGEEEPARR
jgi:hypothetical protein